MSSSLFTELKRRNVYKVGVAYLVLAWVVIQVTSIAVPAMLLPEWVNSTVFLFGAIGFPFALFFAWEFELTPDGVKRESDIAPEDSIVAHTGRKLDFIIIGLLVLVAGYFIYESRFAIEAEKSELTDTISEQPYEVEKPPQESEKSSIAVLAFEDFSPDGDQKYFAHGIADELLNVLVKTGLMKVIGRTSSFSFKDKNVDIPTIAKALNVQHILEGSVTKSKTTLKVTAQLNDANGVHLWSETFKRDYTINDIIEIQEEIAVAITRALNVQLFGIDTSVKFGITDNLQAYELYLQGLKNIYLYTFESLASAVTNFESVIELEPEFLLARIKLAEVFAKQLDIGSRFDRDILDTAESMLKDVLSINPDSAEAYLILSLVTNRKSERELGYQYLKQAYRLNPNDTRITWAYAYAFGYEIGENKARGLFNRLIQIDPLNDRILQMYGRYLENTLQEYTEAEALYKQAFKINPEQGDHIWRLALLYIYKMGNIVEGIQQLEIGQSRDPLDPDSYIFLSISYSNLGFGQKALDFANKAIALNPGTVINGTVMSVKAMALIHLGETDKALMLINETLDDPEMIYRRWPKSSLVHMGIYLLIMKDDLKAAEVLVTKHLPDIISLVDAPPPKTIDEVGDRSGIELLAIVYKAQGKTAKAQRLADRLQLFDESYFSRNKLRIEPMGYLELAMINIIQNNVHQALDYIEFSLGITPAVDLNFFILYSPYFISVHEHPRYIDLIKRVKVELVRQSALLAKKMNGGELSE